MHFLILDLKAFKQEHSFIFSDTKSPYVEAKKDIISVSYFIVLGNVLKNLLFVLRLYVDIM